jgi:hypothetical protein
MPNGLVTGPLTGQIRPLEEGRTVLEACEAWILALSRALSRASASASAMNYGSLLRRPDCDRPGRNGDLPPHDLRACARPTHLRLCATDARSDAAVLGRQPADVVESREQVGEAVGGEHDLERRDVARLIRRNEPVVQPVDCGRVLGA